MPSNAFAISLVVVVLTAASAQAQPRTVEVTGGAMRVWTSGLEQRQPGQPVLILEAGAGSGLESWKPVFADFTALAPVVAYDRRGIGSSKPDANKLTIRGINESLRALLKSIGAEPPYILVGHSWGGALMRGFGELYPTEIAGYVYIEVPDIDATPEKQNAALSADQRSTLSAPTMPPIPADTPPGLRAEMELVGNDYVNYWSQVRNFRQVPGVPVAVIIAAPTGRLKGLGHPMMQLQIKHQSEWALTSSSGLVLVSGRVGHNVMRDDPSLVLQALNHTLKSAGVQK